MAGVKEESSKERQQLAKVEYIVDNTFHQALLSNTAKVRKPCSIRALFPLEAQPGTISLLAGKPK